MNCSVDRTEDFKHAVMELAVRRGCTEAQLKKVTAGFLLPPICAPSGFTLTAVDTLHSIKDLQQLIIVKRREYLDRDRATESERDTIDHQLATIIKTCRQKIASLQEDLERQKASDSLRRPNAQTAAHYQGIVLILSERLQALTLVVDRMRSVRFQQLIANLKPKRRKGVVATPSLGPTTGSQWLGPPEAGGNSVVNGRMQQVVDEETLSLQAELQDLFMSTHQTEAKVLELSALNHVFSVNVLQQAQQIEQLYNEAVFTAENIQVGNVELQKAISTNKSSRVLMLLFFFVLPLALLFYDWYDRRTGPFGW